MLRYHMLVVTRDPDLRRAVRRLTTATGSTAEFVTASSGVGQSSERPINLAIFDAREDAPSNKFLQAIPADAKLMYIIQGDRLADQLALLDDPRVCSLCHHDKQFDDDEFICAATKALRSELFGLQKYFPWGVTTFTMTVRNYEQKTRAIDVLMRYAKLAGVRGSVRDRIQLVADELLMNALYHAPLDADGRPRYAGSSLRELASKDALEPVQVQYGCSGRYFGLSIRDAGGSLTRPKMLEYLKRANSDTQIEDKASGAGLGLLSVMQSVSKLIFNLEPGYSTEVIGLFDMELATTGRPGARSLHIHTSPPRRPATEITSAIPITRSQPVSGAWLLAAVLSVIVVGLATAHYSRAQEATQAEHHGPSIVVVPSPADAEVRINDQPVEGGARIALDGTRKSHQVLVTREGYLPWSETLSGDEIDDNLRVHVVLVPKQPLVR